MEPTFADELEDWGITFDEESDVLRQRWQSLDVDASDEM